MPQLLADFQASNASQSILQEAQVDIFNTGEYFISIRNSSYFIFVATYHTRKCLAKQFATWSDQNSLSLQYIPQLDSAYTLNDFPDMFLHIIILEMYLIQISEQTRLGMI